MQSPEVIRKWQFESLEKSFKSIAALLTITPAEDLTQYRDDGTGWTVTEVLCHLRDFEAIFLERAELTMMQEFPDLPFPNPDQLAQEKAYHSQDAQTVMAEWASYREAFLKFLQSVADEDWERPANHPTRGRFTLNDQLLLAAWHSVNHLEQITHILAEKKTAVS